MAKAKHGKTSTGEDHIVVAAIHSYIKIFNMTKEQRDELHSFLLFKDSKKPVYKKIGGGKRIKIIPEWSPFDRRSRLIGIGFYHYVIAFFKKKKWEYEVRDYREWSFESYTDEELEEIKWNEILYDDKKKEFIKPYYYQIDILKRCLQHRCGVIQAPTGGGKTLTFAMLSAILDMPTLILFNEQGLVHQTYKRFVQYGFNPKKLGIIQAENVRPAQITFATVQSAHKFMEYLNLFKMIVVDECHGVKADQFKKVFVDFEAPVRFGFSGTPWDETDPSHFAKTIQYIGRVIYDESDINTRDLIDQGFLAKDEMYFVTIDRARNDEVVFRKGCPDYRQLYVEEIVNNSYRNDIIAKICKKHINKRIVILYEDIKNKHGELIKEAIQSYEEMADRPIQILSGKNKQKEREFAIELLKKNPNMIIIASRIFNTGIDVPEAEIGINGAAQKSFIAVIQKAGRVLRVTEQKKNMIYYDCFDENSSVFLRQSRERFGIYKRKNLNVKKISPDEL